MNKKFGIAIAIFLGCLLLCCGGMLYAGNTAFRRIRETVAADRVFVRNALTATAKNWEEADFAPFADDAFNAPDKKEQTRKLFATLKEKLGSLETLDEPVVQRQGAFRSSNTGENRGFYVTFKVHAKFAKRNGIFEVTVRNTKDKKYISDISLNPDETMGVSAGNSPSDANTGAF